MHPVVYQYYILSFNSRRTQQYTDRLTHISLWYESESIGILLCLTGIKAQYIIPYFCASGVKQSASQQFTARNLWKPAVSVKRNNKKKKQKKLKLRGRSPQANYTDRATAACRRI
jgi:hypothetical protein